MRQPAAPYHETAVRAEVECICAENGLLFTRDDYGNLLLRLPGAPRRRPLVLAAHLDHPGFEIVRRLPRNRWRARFLGGVADPFFQPGIPLRLMPGAVPATLGKRIGKAKEFEILASRRPAETPQFAVWELEDFAVREGQIHARACDDLGGVTAILAVLIELKRSRARTNVWGVISRAEEVGFHGALTVAASKRLPKNSLIVSLETSRELPPVQMGQGVIIRVGDRTSVFDSAATRFLTEVAGSLRERTGSFQFQRALMAGGSCEGTAFQEFGFQTAAVCVALGNYHNCAEGNRIAAEYVSVADVCGMADLLKAAAREMKRYPQITAALPKRLRQSLAQARRKLRA